MAYPNKNVDTDFSFDYWVDSFHELSWSEMIFNWNFNGDQGDSVFLYFVIVAALVLTAAVFFCFCIAHRCCRKNSRVEIIDEEPNLNLGTNSDHGPGNDTSLVLEDYDTNDHKIATNKAEEKKEIE